MHNQEVVWYLDRIKTLLIFKMMQLRHPCGTQSTQTMYIDENTYLELKNAVGLYIRSPSISESHLKELIHIFNELELFRRTCTYCLNQHNCHHDVRS